MNARQQISASNYLGAYRRIASLLPGQSLDWLSQARTAAIGRFAANGFPTRRDEAWKYTSVGAIEQSRFSVLPEPCAEFLAAQVSEYALPEAHVLVFVNGRLEPRLLQHGRLPGGVVLSGLGYTLERQPHELAGLLLANGADSPFVDLNLAMMADGAYIRLPPGAVVKAPIQLLFIASEANLAIQPRNLVQAGEGSSASIIEHHVALGEAGYFTNSVTNISLGPGARIEHYKLQQESPRAFHIATLNVRQQQDSHFYSASIALGAQLSRTGITVALAGENAGCDLDGLYLGDGRQHVDHHTRIDHLQPACTSRQRYKGILNGAARAVFNGQVVVHPGARGSDAMQTNHNLLLSENTEIDTQPQLEIWADEVKCSHGATVGQLDEAQVFYLRARGIDDRQARQMLTRAFAMEVVHRVRLMSLQARLDRLLYDKLLLH